MLITLVVPVFNEEESIPIFYRTIRQLYPGDAGAGNTPPLPGNAKIGILFINDGSTDKTEELINKYAESDPLVSAISFTRNFGKEAALCAGLENAQGDAIIPIDVDLQDDPNLIGQMITRFQSGADVVLAKRTDRTSDTLFKRKTAQWFYKILNVLSNSNIEEDVGDFRLMSREVVDNINRLQEKNIFMKGILSWVGGRHIEILEYKRAARSAGNSKFSGWKLWNFAIEGITGFSSAPLKISTYFGICVSAMSFFFSLWFFFKKIFFGYPVSGYASLIVSIFFLAGVQLICIGLLGEYVGRIYTEVKARPRYIIKEFVNKEKQNDA